MHRSFAPLRMAVGLAIVLASSLAFAQSAQEDPKQKADAIRKVMDAQVAAWNRGDIEGFMAGYWRSPNLEFYSGATVTKGWDATLERYKKNYQSGGKEMGKLDFSELEIHTNPSDVAWVTGKWHLKMKDASDRGGLFTLIFRKTTDGWKIAHDHTS
jgi:ketosteroid isomerase-like protein